MFALQGTATAAAAAAGSSNQLAQHSISDNLLT
jgi:hypothetical protein